MILVALPVPPSANSLFRNVPGKGRARTAKYNAWRAEAGWMLQAAHPEMIRGDVSLDITLPRPNRRSDIDNKVKAVADLFVTHRLIEDDSRIVELHMRYGPTSECIVAVAEVV